VIIEIVDAVFAVDSVPAIFSINAIACKCSFEALSILLD